VNVAVIGYGYWGPNLVRNFAELPGVQVRWCADVRTERLTLVSQRYPSIRITADAHQLLGDETVEAVVIATPVSTHYALARAALERGKHVLVEKPLARSVVEAERLRSLADQKGLVLMVDHTFIYTGAVRKVKELVDAGELGDLYYLDSVRVNLGLFQSDTDVLWDLAPHDLAILTHLVEEPPRAVSATACDHMGSGFADMAYITVHFAGSFIAHLHVNWLAPTKIRQMLIGGSRRMLVYNDTEPTEKVRIYDRGVHATTEERIHQTLVDYRMGDMWAPKLDNREALARECEHFVDCVRFAKTPWSDATAGVHVVRLIEAAQRSAATGGMRVPV
jgi:predicted dehydrogenase